MAINTGEGGFDIDGKTYTYDVGDPNAPTDPPPNTDHGDVNVDKSKKDISKRTKETLANYLSNLTKPNQFAVDPIAAEIPITTEKAVPPSLAQASNTQQFTPRDDITLPFDVPEDLRLGKRLFDHVSDPNTKLAISKGKAYPQLDNGQVVLPHVEGGDPTKPGTLPTSIQPYVGTVLGNNRFTAAALSSPVNVSYPPNNYDPALSHPKYGVISAGRLAQVGTALSIRASQELGASVDNNNPTGGAQEAKSLLPGFNQLGTERINASVLEARDVFETLTTTEVPSGDVISITPGGSWGALNNVQDPYSGITSLGMIALAAALTAAVVVLFEGLGFLLSLIKGGDKTGAAKSKEGRYALGHYTLVQGPDPNAFPPTSFPPDIGALLGIRPTVHPFAASLQTGVAAFFGIDTSGGVGTAVLSGLASSTSNPGFNAIVARSIIRSTLTIIDAFKHAFDSPNLVSGIKNILTIVDAIRSSKLIASMNVFATLGDQLLVDELLGERSFSELPGEPAKVSTIDNLDDGAGTMKNRLRNTLKLAWSSNRTPSSFLLPSPVLTLAALGKFGAPAIVGPKSPLSRHYNAVLTLTDQAKTALRIPYETNDPTEVSVKGIEGLLEAEYMPFYFHDLRTNEIISFHAFITQLADDFTANWEQTDAYGRVDPIRVYKSTNRHITVGFFVVSTSDEDFNDMWTKINKLVTLVYPQYTQGRLLSDAADQNKFIQPFSQLIGASPLIRLRLGELFKSNYSRFALARLFGADSNVMTLGGTALNFDVAGDLKKALEDDKKDPSGKTYLLTTNNLSKPSEAGGLSVSLPPIPGTQSGAAPATAPTFNVLARDTHFFMFSVSKRLDEDRVVVTPAIMPAQVMQEWLGYSTQAVASAMKYLKDEYDNDKKSAKRVVGGQFVASVNDLIVPPDRLKSIVNKVAAGANSGLEQPLNLLSDFLNPTKNAIVKSFKETRGEGLAGTIDSINFDFYNQTTWETKPGSRAPQFLKVTMAFTPIHDISPGIDHLGYNRGAVYPVGNLANSSDNDKGT